MDQKLGVIGHQAEVHGSTCVVSDYMKPYHISLGIGLHRHVALDLVVGPVDLSVAQHDDEVWALKRSCLPILPPLSILSSAGVLLSLYPLRLHEA